MNINEADYNCEMYRLEQNAIVQPLLTDLYQITMAYAYWKSGKSNCKAVFDLYFRKNPFHGEFTIFAGLEECLKFLEKFHYSDSDIAYLRKILPKSTEDEFFQFLKGITASEIYFYAIPEGTVVFPKEPLIRVEGPLVVAQLIETTLLNLVNYASLMATNAARFRMAAGSIKLYEFGLRRAQGPDGGLSASKYAYIGGFDGTSNVLAGKLFNIPVKGTHAHSYITSFNDLSELTHTKLSTTSGEVKEFLQDVVNERENLGPIFNVSISQASDGELAAFISFAIAFPNSFMALVDTYDVKKSGLINFCAVSISLFKFGYKPLGIRLDSGDLAYLSIVARDHFKKIAQIYKISEFRNLSIMASNDINEETILSLNEQGHQIDSFGIGTHLVTCQKQPALGGVYKMVEIDEHPRIKLSHDVEKVTIPGKKDAYRLYGDSGFALIDILQRSSEDEPEQNKKVLCRHPFQESKRAFVTPTKVEKLLRLFWSNGKICQRLPNMQEIRERVKLSLKILRSDIKRTLNPTPYKVAVSDDLYTFLHDLWLANAPIGELS